MLRIREKTADGAKKYFTAYYVDGQERQGTRRGQGAKQLGLSGAVEKKDWYAICDGIDPKTGKSLLQRKKDGMICGYDFNFSPSKGISVLFATTKDERLVDAIRESVDATMRDIESEVLTRVRKDGKNEERRTGNAIWGEFVHFTSRPVEGRKNDVVPLHPAVVTRFLDCLKGKDGLGPKEPIFALRSKGGSLRATSKMMRLDLGRARAAWLEAAKDRTEREHWEKSDFLKYKDENSLYADFHANRHTFITNLAMAGVHPKLAQSIARHSDLNLTLNVYSHVGIGEQAAAIRTLSAPPAESIPRVDDKKLAHGLAQTSDLGRQPVSSDGNVGRKSRRRGDGDKSLKDKEIVILCHSLTPDDLSSGGGTRTPDTRIMIPLL
jgi:hypothetical protein